MSRAVRKRRGVNTCTHFKTIFRRNRPTAQEPRHSARSRVLDSQMSDVVHLVLYMNSDINLFESVPSHLQCSMVLLILARREAAFASTSSSSLVRASTSVRLPGADEADEADEASMGASRLAVAPACFCAVLA